MLKFRCPRRLRPAALVLALLLVSGCLPQGPWGRAAQLLNPTRQPASSESAVAAPTPLPLEADATAGRPPLTPRWVYEPWVWEEEEHTAEAVLELVDGYRQHGIPVGAVIIDSPWQTNYNTFVFGPNYPDPEGLIRALKERNLRVLLWATPFINVKSIDNYDEGKSPNYDEAHAAGYFVADGQAFDWDKGDGSAIDFFNPRAVAWLFGQMDRAFSLGIDGWKADSPEGSLPDEVATAAGPKTEREYGRAYYRSFYRYVVERNPEAIIFARPSEGGTIYAPIDANPAGWVGDQDPDWGRDGLPAALDDILVSAELGYAVLGSDIGGYREGQRSERLFIRWTQLGALSPLMENGGQGEHRPWGYGPRALAVYRYFAKLHHQLVPYFHSLGIEAHLTGQPIIRNVDRPGRQYTLGEDLLVAPLVTRDDERTVQLPAGAPWHDYWSDDRLLDGGQTFDVESPLEQLPLYVRAGAIIPMQVDDPETGHGDQASAGHLTLLLYPEGESVRTYYAAPDEAVELRSRRDAGGVTVEVGPRTERYVLRIKEPARPAAVQLQHGGRQDSLAELPSRDAFAGSAEGWYYDPSTHYLWVRFATEGSAARLSYATVR